MSKILRANETGFGVLIETDAGFIDSSQKLNFLNEDYKLDLNTPIIIDCILQKYGVKNKNGRIYPKDVLIPQVDLYQELIDTNSAISESDHPNESIISLHNISHMITKMWWGKGQNENVLYGQLKLIISPGYIKYGIVSVIGDKILLYLQNKIRLGISSRGVGTLKEINGENIVQNDFELIGFDLVATPSTPGAYLFPNNTINFDENSIKRNNIQINEDNNKLIKTLNNFLL